MKGVNRIAIELPKDGNGEVIPFNTTMMYRENGNQFHVSDLFFEARPRRWFARSGSECIEESNLCMYYNQNLDCNNCTISGNESRGCTSIALEDIKKRIRMLRGED